MFRKQSRQTSRTERRLRRGNALVEFSLMGIPIIFITISIVSISLDMWAFFTLAYSTEATARYASVHGATCTLNTNTCTIRISDVTAFFESHSQALDPGKVTVKLIDGSGTTTCNPVTSCDSSTAQFPNSSYNAIGSDLKITATYSLDSPIAMFWPASSEASSSYRVGATSRQRIIF